MIIQKHITAIKKLPEYTSWEQLQLLAKNMKVDTAIVAALHKLYWDGKAEGTVDTSTFSLTVAENKADLVIEGIAKVLVELRDESVLVEMFPLRFVKEATLSEEVHFQELWEQD